MWWVKWPLGAELLPVRDAGLGAQGTAATPGQRHHGRHMAARQRSARGPWSSAGRPGTATVTAEKEQSVSPVHPDQGDSGQRGAETRLVPRVPAPSGPVLRGSCFPGAPALPAVAEGERQDRSRSQHAFGEAGDRDRTEKLGFWLADCC